jgi:hypothetical protein
MKFRIFTLSSLAVLMLISCGSETKTDNTVSEELETETVSDIKTSEAYLLMQQKCFICHMEKPDPSKKGSMLAPPMMRIQAHYKPSFSDRESFVNAVSSFVTNPTEEAVLMPGAVRKFNIMTNLNYNKEEVEKIAGLLYDMDFGDFSKMHEQKRMKQDSMKLSLNNGLKWKLKPEGINKVNDLLSQDHSLKYFR